ncbi:MAG: hypothetical protein V1720_20575 [bacterium]
MITFVFVIFTAGCSKTDDTSTDPLPENNLLTNGSFEINGAASTSGWTEYYLESSVEKFSTDTPIGGGSFSVKLKNIGWMAASVLHQKLVVPPGTNRYRLTTYSKAIESQLAGGEMSINIYKNGSWTTSKRMHFSDTTWTTGSLLDTISTETGDTISIRLNSDDSQFSRGYILFDLIKFVKVE